MNRCALRPHPDLLEIPQQFHDFPPLSIGFQSLPPHDLLLFQKWYSLLSIVICITGFGSVLVCDRFRFVSASGVWHLASGVWRLVRPLGFPTMTMTTPQDFLTSMSWPLGFSKVDLFSEDDFPATSPTTWWFPEYLLFHKWVHHLL